MSNERTPALKRQTRPHSLYLFQMKNGKKKIAYGESPEDALRILATRLSEAELAEILPGSFERISQRRLLDRIEELG
jgi:hypothetical protein